MIVLYDYCYLAQKWKFYNIFTIGEKNSEPVRYVNYVFMKRLKSVVLNINLLFLLKNILKLRMISLPGTGLGFFPIELFSSSRLQEAERNPGLSQCMDIPDDTLAFIIKYCTLK